MVGLKTWNHSLAEMAHSDAELCCKRGYIAHDFAFLQANDLGQNLYILYGRVDLGLPPEMHPPRHST